MLCNEASKLLSEYFDGALDAEMSVRTLQHLKQCENCRKELDTLSALHERLKSLERIEAPDYLGHLVQKRLKNERKNTWCNWLKDAAALRWSRIRTTGIQFYWTKALGTATAAFFLFIISHGIDMFSVPYTEQPTGLDVFYSEYREQGILTISEKLGRFPIEQYRRNDLENPAISDDYYTIFWDRIPESTGNDGISVVFEVDRSGTVNLEKVLESPDHQDLMDSVNDVFMSARGRPASRNGRSISSKMVINFIRMVVSAD